LPSEQRRNDGIDPQPEEVAMQCPNRERLVAFLAGLATDEESAHIEGCPVCLQALDELPNDDVFEGAVRSAAAEPPFPEGSDDLATRIVPPHPEATIVPNDLPAFDRVGEYDLLFPIGSGGMGEVFEARQRSTDRIVAVKTIRLSHFLDHEHEGLRRRFRRELRIAARLEHPNIVRVYHAGEDGDRPFLVMERLHGETFKQVVARRGPLTIADACAVACQVAEGLAFAHAQDVIHRDVKPGNVFLTRAGTVKLLDWGLAKQGDTDDLTRPDEGAGTPGYAPPEQRVSIARVDRRADVYALGATLFFALTGQVAGGTADVPDTLPPALADLLRRMLANDPNGRPPSVVEVGQRLADFGRGADLKALAGNADALLAALAVRWWDAAANRDRLLDDTGALPMPSGTRLHVEARLNRPAYLYLLWIASDGVLYPLHGWLPDSWKPDPAAKEADRLRVPEYDPVLGWKDIPLEGPAGTETIVLLARTAPLSEDVSRHFPPGLQDVLGRALKQMPPDPRRAYEFLGSQEGAGGLRGPGKALASADPLSQVQALLRDCLGPHFALIRALSFANRGR